MQEDYASLEELTAGYSDFRDGNSKAIAIIRSSLAILSVFASSILVWMINRSSDRFSTTYHRILLGMSIADILYSLSLSLFNVLAPTDDAYMVWNARGNMTTCSFQGFILFLGAGSGLMYSCSLNLYYLALVKHQKTDTYIRTKIEPYLHGVPILYAVVFSITLTALKHFNDNGNGLCYAPVYNPPHCEEYEYGEIPEGFEIPCGRGRDGAVLLYYLVFFVTTFVVPIVVGVSLWMIYKAVLQQEKRIARFAFTPNAEQSCTNDANVGVGKSWKKVRDVMRSAVSRFRNESPSGQHSATTDQDRSKYSRAVMYRALAYSSAYFLTWTFTIILTCLNILGVELPIILRYLSTLFGCLQGFFNWLIYIHPTVIKAKSSGDGTVTWCQALAKAFWSNGAVDRSSGGGRSHQKIKVSKKTKHSANVCRSRGRKV